MWQDTTVSEKKFASIFRTLKTRLGLLRAFGFTEFIEFYILLQKT
jgi:hypothetical protein